MFDLDCEYEKASVDEKVFLVSDVAKYYQSSIC